jgi:hypothetical protein
LAEQIAVVGYSMRAPRLEPCPIHMEAVVILWRNLLQRLYEWRMQDLSTWDATRRVVQLESYRAEQLQRRFARRLAEQEPPEAA